MKFHNRLGLGILLLAIALALLGPLTKNYFDEWAVFMYSVVLLVGFSLLIAD